ncbi:hypothetical protein [Kitasatospora sp. NPDC005751]|uniref:hypothetical protein n=1 Tax=unclassified Kitasatospora TaxID=2633591 RepID=UPI0033E432B0
MPKTAKSEQEANELLTAYCLEIDFSKQWIAAEKWATSIRIAMNPAEGIESAKSTIDSDKRDVQDAAARTQRQTALTPHLGALRAAIQADNTVSLDTEGKLLAACTAQYVGGGGVDLGYPTGLTASQYAVQQGRWNHLATLGAGAPFIGGFHALPPQDKAAAGKANVGATLATRKWQGNLFVTIGGVTFNLHLDVKM